MMDQSHFNQNVINKYFLLTMQTINKYSLIDVLIFNGILTSLATLYIAIHSRFVYC
jgi:hypothetical protein